MEGCNSELDNNHPAMPIVGTGYESMGVVLYPATFLSNQVITVTPSNSGELHPLEVEVQRSLEAKRQNQLARLNNSVIQTLSNVTHSAALPSSIHRHETSVSDQQELLMHTEEPLSHPHIYHAASEGRSETLFLAGNGVDNSAHQDSADTMDLDSSQIPLTVQHCVQTAELPYTADTSGSDDNEHEDVEPVCEDEPDPDPGSCLSLSIDSDTIRCYMCFTRFRQKKNMYAHIRKIHGSQPKITGGIICPLCKMHSLRHQHLRSHIETLHQIPIAKEERQFRTMQEFMEWKIFVEKETFSSFISKSATKLLSHNETKTYFKCHRSGYSQDDKTDGRKKNSIKDSSYKIGATCPASMEVIENVDGVIVTFWATHVGHETSSRELLLSSEMSWDQVLEMPENEQEDLDLRPIPELEGSSCVMKYVLMDNKRISLGRKPPTNRPVRKVTQSQLIDKASLLLDMLETTEVMPACRPKISVMIDNLVSIVKRRTVDDTIDKSHKKRKKGKKPPDNVAKEKSSRTEKTTSKGDHRYSRGQGIGL